MAECSISPHTPKSEGSRATSITQVSSSDSNWDVLDSFSSDQSTPVISNIRRTSWSGGSTKASPSQHGRALDQQYHNDTNQLLTPNHFSAEKILHQLLQIPQEVSDSKEQQKSVDNYTRQLEVETVQQPTPKIKGSSVYSCQKPRILMERVQGRKRLARRIPTTHRVPNRLPKEVVVAMPCPSTPRSCEQHMIVQKGKAKAGTHQLDPDDGFLLICPTIENDLAKIHNGAPKPRILFPGDFSLRLQDPRPKGTESKNSDCGSI